MPALWIDLAHTFRRAVPLLLALGAIHVAANTVLPYALEGWVPWVLLPVVNYFLYRIALFDLRAPYLASFAHQAPPEAIFRFLLVLALPFVLAAGALVLLFLIIRPDNDPVNDLILLCALAVFWLVLSIFGTLLPATAALKPFSIDTALHVAASTWMNVALQLLLVAAVMGAVIIMVMVAGKDWLDDLPAAPPFHHAVDILLTAFGWASQVPAVVILTRAYRFGWPQPVPARSNA